MNATMTVTEEWYGNGIAQIGVLHPTRTVVVQLSSYRAGCGDGFGFMVDSVGQDRFQTITLAPGSYRFHILGEYLSITAEYDLGCKRQRVSIKSKIGGAQ